MQEVSQDLISEARMKQSYLRVQDNPYCSVSAQDFEAYQMDNLGGAELTELLKKMRTRDDALAALKQRARLAATGAFLSLSQKRGLYQCIWESEYALLLDAYRIRARELVEAGEYGSAGCSDACCDDLAVMLSVFHDALGLDADQVIAGGYLDGDCAHRIDTLIQLMNANEG